MACALVLAGVAILGRFDWRTLQFWAGSSGRRCWVRSSSWDRSCGWKGWNLPGNRPGKITLVMFATEAVVFTGLVLATAPSLAAIAVPFTSPAWLLFTLTLTFFCTIGAFTIMNTYQPRITATEAGLIYCIEPVFGSLLALFLPGLFSIWAGIAYGNETATWTLLLGGGLITAANLLIQFKPAAKAR